MENKNGKEEVAKVVKAFMIRSKLLKKRSKVNEIKILRYRKEQCNQ